MIYLGDKEVGVVVDSIDLSQTTATADDVLEGKEFFNASGEKVAGTYKDMLQARTDVTNSCRNLFLGYPGDNVDYLANLDTSNVTTMESMFYECRSLTTIPLLNTGKVTTMYQMFYKCSSLHTIPALDTSNVTNMESMLYYCYGLTTMPLLDTSSVTNMNSMLWQCSKLENIPLLDTSSVTNMSNMLGGTGITTIPALDTSNVTTMSQMFYDCRSLTTIPALDTSSVTNMGNMFNGCRELTTIFLLDMFSATSTSSMFNKCSTLANLTLKNIRVSLQIGSGTSWGHLLTLDSLLNTIKELWTNTGTSTLTLTMGTANTAKLADVYVKLIDITDEMRAEDEYIDNKAPFEVCESTDEGAMLVTEYVTTVKNWQLA